jgi:hypothetical protein
MCVSSTFDRYLPKPTSMLMKKSLFTIIILIALLRVGRASNQPAFINHDQDPFAPYLNSIPTVLQVLNTVNSGSFNDGIVTKELIFSSKNGINRIFSIMAYPQRSGKFPGVMVIHAGDGSAQSVRGVVERLARNGYAAIACDMAGFCHTAITPNSSGPWKATLASNEAVLWWMQRLQG